MWQWALYKLTISLEKMSIGSINFATELYELLYIFSPLKTGESNNAAVDRCRIKGGGGGGGHCTESQIHHVIVNRHGMAAPGQTQWVDMGLDTISACSESMFVYKNLN